MLILVEAARNSPAIDYVVYHCILLTSRILYISKMYFSHWEPPGVSERRRSVNLEASISGENQTLGGHSGRPSE